METAGVH